MRLNRLNSGCNVRLCHKFSSRSCIFFLTRLFQVSLLGKIPSLLYAVKTSRRPYFPRILTISGIKHLLSAIYRIRAYSVQKYDPYPMLKIQSTQLTKQNKLFEVYFRLNRVNGNYAMSCFSPRPSMESLHILYITSMSSFHS